MPGKVGHPHTPQIEGSNPRGEVGHPLSFNLEGSKPPGEVRQSLAHYLEGSKPLGEGVHPLAPPLHGSNPRHGVQQSLAHHLEGSKPPGEMVHPLFLQLQESHPAGEVQRPLTPNLEGIKPQGEVVHPRFLRLQESHPAGEVQRPLTPNLKGSQPTGELGRPQAPKRQRIQSPQEVGHPLAPIYKEATPQKRRNTHMPPHPQRSQLPEEVGHHLASYLEESQPPGESRNIYRNIYLDFSSNDAAIESLRNEAFDNEESEQMSVVMVGSNRSCFKVICDHCKSLLISGNFWYYLIFGILPSAWDTFTDLGIDKILEEEEDFHSAAACWMLVCLPPVYCSIENLANRCKSAGFQIAVLIIGISGTLLCGFVSIMWFPRLLFYPAVFCVFILLLVKILAVFCPTPGIKQLSSKLSWAESSIEASCQLLLLIFLSLTSGKLHLSVMISSIVIIGKVRAENYLASGPEDLLKDKSFKEKIALVLRFLPLFSLTARVLPIRSICSLLARLPQLQNLLQPQCHILCIHL